MQREFIATGINQLWLADMTYMPTWAGFVHRMVVLDMPLVERFDPQHLLAYPHGHALDPAGGDVGQRQGVGRNHRPC